MATILENNTEQYELECQALPTSDSIKLSLDITYESKDSNTVEATEIANLTTSGREYSSISYTELTPINTIATDQSGKYTEDMSALFGSAFSSSITLSPANQVVIETFPDDVDLIDPFVLFIFDFPLIESEFDALSYLGLSVAPGSNDIVFRGNDEEYYAIVKDSYGQNQILDLNGTFFITRNAVLITGNPLYTFENLPY